MGLDIYLISREQHAAEERHEREWEACYNKYHKENGDFREGVTQEQYDEARKQVPEWPSRSDAEVKSRQHPECYSNRRYVRSSYNDSGFNSAVPEMIGVDHGFYWIFEPVIGDNPEPYHTDLTEEHIPRLEQAIERARQVAQEIRNCDGLQTMTAGPILGSNTHQWREPPSEKQVLDWYREEAKRQNTSGGGYSNAKGLVLGFDEGFEILALTVSANPLARFSAGLLMNTVGANIGALPQAIAVYRMSDDTKKSYIDTAEVVAEFCEEAIELIKSDGGAVMSWSG